MKRAAMFLALALALALALVVVPPASAWPPPAPTVVSDAVYTTDTPPAVPEPYDDLQGDFEAYTAIHYVYSNGSADILRQWDCGEEGVVGDYEFVASYIGPQEIDPDCYPTSGGPIEPPRDPYQWTEYDEFYYGYFLALIDPVSHPWLY